MLPGVILEFYNSVTMYLTPNILNNKVNVDLEFLFFMHDNDRDPYGNFGNTAIEKLSYAIRVVDILREKRPLIPQILRISLLHAFFLLLTVLNVFSPLWSFSLSSD